MIRRALPPTRRVVDGMPIFMTTRVCDRSASDVRSGGRVEADVHQSG